MALFDVYSLPVQTVQVVFIAITQVKYIQL